MEDSTTVIMLVLLLMLGGIIVGFQPTTKRRISVSSNDKKPVKLMALRKARDFRVFVYGTLKKGYNNHDMLGDYTPCGVAKVHDLALFIYTSGIPFAVPSEGDNIYGEIYIITQKDFDRINRMEYAAGYRRVQPRVNGTKTHMWIMYPAPSKGIKRTHIPQGLFTTSTAAEARSNDTN